MELDLQALTLAEIFELQKKLERTLEARFEKPLAVLYTDVDGAAAYAARHGDEAARRLQQRHADLVTEAVLGRAGSLVAGPGTALFASFATVEQAAEALVQVQGAVAAGNATRERGHLLSVRAGLHFGRAITDGTHVSGEALDVAAGLAASASGGEILVSAAAARELPPALRARCKLARVVPVEGVPTPVEALRLSWADDALFPTKLRVDQTGEEIVLPALDLIRFGRIAQLDGEQVNDVALAHPDPKVAARVSRWHFELHRRPGGFVLRCVSEQITEVDGVQVRKGGEIPLRIGSVVNIASALTLHFLRPGGVLPLGADTSLGGATTTMSERPMPPEAVALLEELNREK